MNSPNTVYEAFDEYAQSLADAGGLTSCSFEDFEAGWQAARVSQPMILRKQAEAVEAATRGCQTKSATDDSKCYSTALIEYAQCLRQQADKEEQA